MDELRLLGVHEDGEHLLLATADDQQRFRLPLNDALRAAVRWERGNRPSSAGALDGEELRPRDVQAMIRAGATAEEAAERANWSVDKVRRFESPILAERAYMATEAGRAHVRSRAGAVTLTERVTERLDVRGVSAESVTWDSWRDEDGQWTVELRFAAGGRQRTASWHFNRSLMTVSARDDEARWLSEEQAEPEPAEHVVPTRGRVYDVEAEGGLRPATPTTSDDEVTLMAAVRERSTARRRRGQRKSPAASPTALPPLGDAAPVEAPPLAELRYDPATMPPPPAAHGEPEVDGIDGRPEPAVLADRGATDGVLAGFDDDEPVAVGSDEDDPVDADDVPAPPTVVFDDELDEPSADSATAPDDEPATPEPVAALPPYSVASDTVDEPELPLSDEADPTDRTVAGSEATAGSEAVAGSEASGEPRVEPTSEGTPVAKPAAKPRTRPATKPRAAATPSPTTAAEDPGPAADEATGTAPTGAADDATGTAPATKPRSGQRAQPSRSPRSRRKGRASVPAWDDIVFGAKPGQDE